MANKDDHKLDNLIKDIMNGKVAKNAWSKQYEVGTSKRVRSGKDEDSIEKVETKKPRVAKRTTATVHENVDLSGIGDLGGLVNALTDKVDQMDSKINARLMAMDNDIAKLKEEVRQLREVPTNGEGVDQTSPNKTPSWLQAPVVNVDVGEVTSKKKNKKAEVKGVVETDIQDITEQMQKEENQIQSDTESDPILKAQQQVLKKNLDILTAALEDGYDRPKKLGPTQKSPFQGNSTVKRIMEADAAFGCHPSDVAYDPFAPVAPEKLQNLMDFIRVRQEQPIGTFDSELNFYLRLITPKQNWPEEEKSNYGWLGDQHMCSAMNMLRKRSLREPTPFRTGRIAFLDQWFVDLWYLDYKQFAISPPKFMFRDGYKSTFQGTSPEYAQTKKTWIDDVDVVYFFHNVNNNHWIMCEMDLNKEMIEIYDSIIPKTWQKVVDLVRPYAKMVPYWIKAFTPKEKRKGRKLTPFKLHYNKQIPQNVQTGDCGVYSIKFVECLALGYKMDDLSDNTIADIRLKLGAEIFDEVRDANPQMSDPKPRGQDKVRIPTEHPTQP